MDGNDAPVYFGMGDAQRIDRTVNHFEHNIIGRPTPRKQQQQFGGGGAQIIRFTVTSVDCDAGTAVGTVTAVMCSGSEVEVGDEVDLIDSMSLLTGNPDLVMGGSGFAVKMDEPGSYGSGCVYDIFQTSDLGSNCG